MGRKALRRPYPINRASRCHTCGHFRFAGGGKMKVCLYILDTGHMRGCGVADCDKYLKGCVGSELDEALRRMGMAT